MKRTASILLAFALPLAAAGPIWRPRTYLKASNADPGDRFGSAIAVSGDTIVVGAPREDSAALGVGGNPLDNGATETGAAYVFVQSGGAWTQQAYLKPTANFYNSGFGSSVAISGDTIVVGSPNEVDKVNPGPPYGSAYVFVRNGTTWTPQARLVSPGTTGPQWFGCSVSIDGNTIAVGGSFDGPPSGSVTIYVRNGTTWSQQGRFTGAPMNGPGQEPPGFGTSVSISGNTLIVGSPKEYSAATAATCGSSYVYLRTGTTWAQQAKLTAETPPVAGSQFGTSVAISGDTALVGAPALNGGIGGTYVFTRSGAAWTKQAVLSASNGEAADSFGMIVALYGDTAVIGAPQEDGSGADPSDNSAPNAGAVYVFTRTGSAWTQASYLKPTALDANDQFGSCIALDPSRICIGAPAEDGGGTGVNPDPADNGAGDSGAAYIFGLWSAPTTQGVEQVTSEGAVIPVGESAHSTFSVRATVAADAAAPAHLQVEVKPAGVAFDGGGLREDADVPSGTIASVAIGGLALRGYHWRCRAVDAFGSSDWFAYGGNADPDGVDVVLVNSPAVAGGPASQRRDGDASPLGPGATLFDHEALHVEGPGSDPDGDAVHLEIEIRPVGTAFLGEATHAGAAAVAGAPASCRAGLPHGSWHWQSRIADPAGEGSAWAPFGGNSEDESDITILWSGSTGPGRCLASAPMDGPVAGWLLGLAAGVAGVLRRSCRSNRRSRTSAIRRR